MTLQDIIDRTGPTHCHAFRCCFNAYRVLLYHTGYNPEEEIAFSRYVEDVENHKITPKIEGLMCRLPLSFLRSFDRSSSGMMGSQANLGSERSGPQLPGLENLGADAIVAGKFGYNSSHQLRNENVDVVNGAHASDGR